MLTHCARTSRKLSTGPLPKPPPASLADHNERMPGPSSPASRLLTLAQTAELLTLEIDDVMALLHAGELRGVRLGQGALWRVEHASVSAYVADQIEQSRRMHLWRQSNAASFPELWGTGAIRHGD